MNITNSIFTSTFLLLQPNVVIEEPQNISVENQIKKQEEITREEVKKIVYKVIVETLGVEKSQITESKRYVFDFGIDSLDYAELIVNLEKEFNIQIPDEKAMEIGSVKGSINAIHDILNNKK